MNGLTGTTAQRLAKEEIRAGPGVFKIQALEEEKFALISPSQGNATKHLAQKVTSEIVLFHIELDLIFACSGDCTVGLWSQWTTCSKTCDGRQDRSRRIANPKIGEGKDCPVLRQWAKCSSNSCPGHTTENLLLIYFC